MRETKAKLVVRPAALTDVAAISALTAKVYGAAEGYTRAQLRGQINNFPEGTFVAEYEGDVVGYCATVVVTEDLALAPHTWDEITGGGYGSRHNPDGDILYGTEVSVDPDYRRLRIGQRLYRARRGAVVMMRISVRRGSVRRRRETSQPACQSG